MKALALHAGSAQGLEAGVAGQRCAGAARNTEAGGHGNQILQKTALGGRSHCLLRCLGNGWSAAGAGRTAGCAVGEFSFLKWHGPSFHRRNGIRGN